MLVSTALRNYFGVTGSYKDAMDSCVIKFYGSPVSQAAANALIPATADAALGSATLMCTISVDGGGTAFTYDAVATDGVVTKTSTEDLTGEVVATGYYSFCRIVKTTDTGALSTSEYRLQLTVGTVPGMSDCIVNSMYKTIGDFQPINALYLAFPSGA